MYLYLFGISFGLSVAWWQEALGWNYIFRFCNFYNSIDYSLKSFTQNQRLIFLALGYASGIAMDLDLYLFYLQPYYRLLLMEEEKKKLII